MARQLASVSPSQHRHICVRGKGLQALALTVSIAVFLSSRSYAQQEVSPSDAVILNRLPAAAGPDLIIPDPVTSNARMLPRLPANGTPPTAASTESNAATAQASNSEGEDALPQASAMDPTARRYQEILLRARGELNESRLPDPEAAKTRLQNAIRQLENYVGPGSTRGENWFKFLRVDEIREELESERPNFNKFIELEMNMRQNYIGLEYGPFLELRNSLNGMMRASKYGSAPERTVQVLTARIDATIEKLNEAPTNANSERASELGRVLSYLYESNQTPSAVAELRNHFRTPNVHVYATETLLQKLASRVVAEPSPVNECILGTRVIGRACLTGSVDLDLLPMNNAVSFSLNMNAMLTSNNRGFNRGVVLRTTGSSPVHAAINVVASPNGISSAPATVSTNLTTSINAIEHKLRIVRRIAKRKAAEQKPQADAIAEGRMRRKIRDQYEQQVTEQLADANVRLASFKQQQENRPELKRLSIPMPAYAIHSTDHTVNADVVHAASFQLAAEQPCKIQRPGTSDIVLELHQSLPINALESLLAGRKLRNHDLDDWAMQFLGEVPPEILAEATGDPWEITFEDFNPIQIEFDNDQIKLTLRLASMEGNDRSIPRGAIVSATYSPNYKDGVLTLLRDGELEVEVPNVRSSIQATSLRSVVKKKFDTILKEEIVTEKLDLSGRFPNAADLVINWIKINGGWMQIGVR